MLLYKSSPCYSSINWSESMGAGGALTTFYPPPLFCIYALLSIRVGFHVRTLEIQFQGMFPGMSRFLVSRNVSPGIQFMEYVPKNARTFPKTGIPAHKFFENKYTCLASCRPAEY